jgi:nicotinate-nucleotide adenylyltransferase
MDNLKYFSEIEALLKIFMQNDQLSATCNLSNPNLSFKICFYPGSFNPWHDGHSSCVTLHQKYYPDIPLMILPDQNPHKIDSSIDLLKLPKNLSLNDVFLSHVFKQNNLKNPTYRWITFLKVNCPKLELGLLLGLDSYLNLTTWTNSRLLLENLSFLEIIPRNIKDLSPPTANYNSEINSYNPKLKLNFVPENPFESVSSTQLRQK